MSYQTARVTSHIPDKGQVMIRYYGLYSNAHRGKMRKEGALLHESETWALLPLTSNSIQPHTIKVHPFRASDSG